MNNEKMLERRNPDAYDSHRDTYAHILRVRELLEVVVEGLQDRGMKHDASKLQEPEKSGFDRATPRLKDLEYGKENYEISKQDLSVELAHHYANNSHHPQHYPKVWNKELQQIQDDINTLKNYPKSNLNERVIKVLEEKLREDSAQINGFDLLDLVEYFCDIKAAGERNKNGALEKSIIINKEKYNVSRQLSNILENTRKRLGWK